MTYDEYVEIMNDPRRPMGLWGPFDGAMAYRIDTPPPVARSPGAETSGGR